MNKIKIEVRGLYFEYSGDDLIFKDFNFVTKSPLVVLKGRSGCGKTTLLKLITGLLKPQKGEIVFYPKNLSLKKYYITQDIALFPWLTGYDNILLNKNLKVEQIKKHKLFPLVEDYIGKKCYQMSFGQRRKVELLRAFLSEPDILFLDEPLNFIDKSGRDELTNFIKDFSEKSLVVITSHYHEEIKRFDGEVYQFDDNFPITELKSVKV